MTKITKVKIKKIKKKSLQTKAENNIFFGSTLGSRSIVWIYRKKGQNRLL